jgi:hypothetical protein
MLLSLESDNTLTTISDNDTHSISGTTNPIIIKSGYKPTLILTDVTINSTPTPNTQATQYSPAILIEAGATLYLQLEGNNTLTAGLGCAAICVEPAYDKDWNYLEDSSAYLYISGSGNLTATGGNGYTGTSIDDTSGGGAGIGGNGCNYDGDFGGVDFGTITITNEFTGIIIANGGTYTEAVFVPYSSFPKDGTYEGFGGGAGIGSGGFNTQRIDWGIVYGQVTIANGTIQSNPTLKNSMILFKCFSSKIIFHRIKITK